MKEVETVEEVKTMLPEEYVAKLEAIKAILEAEASRIHNSRVEEMSVSYNFVSPGAPLQAVAENWRNFPVGYGIVDVKQIKGAISRLFLGKEKLTPILTACFNPYAEDSARNIAYHQVSYSKEPEYVKELANKSGELTITPCSEVNNEILLSIKRSLDSRLVGTSIVVKGKNS